MLQEKKTSALYCLKSKHLDFPRKNNTKSTVFPGGSQVVEADVRVAAAADAAVMARAGARPRAKTPRPGAFGERNVGEV